MIRSIRSQAQLYYGSLVVALMVLILIGFNYYERFVRLRTLDEQISEQLALARPLMFGGPEDRRLPPKKEDRDFEFRRPDRGRPPPPEEFNIPRKPRPPKPRKETEASLFRESEQGEDVIEKLVQNDYYVIGFQPNREQLFRSENAPDARIPFAKKRDRENFQRWSGDYREAIQFGPGRGYLLVGTDASRLHEGLNRLMLNLTLACFALTGVILALGWVLIGRALRPIDQITKVAQSICEGDSSRRIDTKSIRNELGPLGKILNTTFDRLVRSVRQQIRITADASHELRTPVSVILADCDLALRKESSAERKQEALELCRETALHMKRLIESLTQMARWDSSSEILNKERCDLSQIAEQTAKMFTSLAEEKDIEVVLETMPCIILCDPLAIKQTLANLISNAIHYNKPSGKVTIRTRRIGKSNMVEIEDTGVGIASEDLPKIFERFYRVDKAREIEEGHSGLGLSISKAIVEAHGGSIEAYSQKGIGTRFVVQLP